VPGSVRVFVCFLVVASRLGRFGAAIGPPSTGLGFFTGATSSFGQAEGKSSSRNWCLFSLSLLQNPADEPAGISGLR